MIVIVGNPLLRPAMSTADAPGLAGTAALVAAAAAAAGSTVQLVGRAGDDPAGDELVLALAEAGVGHVALSRVARSTPTVRSTTADEADPMAEPADEPSEGAVSPGIGLDEADVELALRYLTEFGVVVVAPDVSPEVSAVAVRAAGWSSATPIVLLDASTEGSPSLPPGAIVLAAPETDAGGAFAVLVGELAAAIDRGEDPGSAFKETLGRTGWEPAEID